MFTLNWKILIILFSFEEMNVSSANVTVVLQYRDSFTKAVIKNMIVVVLGISINYINASLIHTFSKHQVECSSISVILPCIELMLADVLLGGTLVCFVMSSSGESDVLRLTVAGRSWLNYFNLIIHSFRVVLSVSHLTSDLKLLLTAYLLLFPPSRSSTGILGIYFSFTWWSTTWSKWHWPSCCLSSATPSTK